MMEANHCTVGYDWNAAGRAIEHSWARSWLRRTFGDVHFQTVKGVAIWNSNDSSRLNTDGVVRLLRAWPGMRSIDIDRAGATDRALEVIGELSDLEDLCVREGEFTERGIARLRPLNKLTSLTLEYCAFPDYAVRHLDSLSGLQILKLKQYPMTDRGMASLPAMRSIKSFLLHEYGDFGQTISVRESQHLGHC
jgi:hypothetical protein